MPAEDDVQQAADALKHWDKILTDEFKGESDRACVILAAALLDAAVDTLLKAMLVPTNAPEDPLFDGANAPLGTFSARIEMGYRLGLYDAGFARNLHLVRKIRNDFAHNVAGCTFSDSAVIGRLTELRRATTLPEAAREIRGSYPVGPRGDFQMIVAWMQWMLRAVAERGEPLGQRTAIRGSFRGVKEAGERAKEMLALRSAEKSAAHGPPAGDTSAGG